MAITPILNNNIEAVIASQINSKYEQVDKVANKIDDVVSLAGNIDSSTDFDVLTNAINALTAIRKKGLDGLATVDLVSIKEDIEKGTRYGARKLDIDLSLLINNGVAPKFNKLTVVSLDGINIDKSFSPTESPTLIMQHIKDAIDSYNEHESDIFKQVKYVQYELLNETIPSEPTIIRLYDEKGKAAELIKVKLYNWNSNTIETYDWAKTSSALQVVSNVISEVIDLGRRGVDISTLASKIDELLEIHADLRNLDVVTANIDNNNISKVVTNIDNNNVSKIVTHIDNQDISKVAGNVADIQTVAGNTQQLHQFHEDIVEVNKDGLAPKLIKVDSVFQTTLSTIPSGSGLPVDPNDPSQGTYIPLYGRDPNGNYDSAVGTNSISYGPITTASDVNVEIGSNSTWTII